MPEPEIEPELDFAAPAPAPPPHPRPLPPPPALAAPVAQVNIYNVTGKILIRRATRLAACATKCALARARTQIRESMSSSSCSDRSFRRPRPDRNRATRLRGTCYLSMAHILSAYQLHRAHWQAGRGKRRNDTRRGQHTRTAGSGAVPTGVVVAQQSPVIACVVAQAGLRRKKLCARPLWTFCCPGYRIRAVSAAA